jgi:hypothetical protein
MSASRKTSTSPVEKTINWFEHEILAHTAQQSLLDATSLGIWTICEQSGILAGAWKQHRILRQDLNVEQVTAALGELLAAIAQTAHAIDAPLETLMQQQVARAQALAGSRQRKLAPAASPRQALAAVTFAVAESAPTQRGSDTPAIPPAAKPRRGRPRRADVAQVSAPPPETPTPVSSRPVSAVKRERRPKLPVSSAPIPAPVISMPTPSRRAQRTIPVQPILFDDAVTTAAPKRRRQAGEHAR